MNVQTVYNCAKCGAQFSKWNGRCFECGGWGTLKQETVDSGAISQKVAKVSGAEIINLSQLKAGTLERLKSGINEVDRVLGGGFVPGSLVLIAGEPGIGKSTIVSQIALSAGKEAKNIVYVSGEESAVQVKERFSRMKNKDNSVSFIGETNIERIIASLIEAKPKIVVIDSIQTVYSSDIPSEAGSINQIRNIAIKLLEVAKGYNITVILIGHITKDGQVAGPKTLEHIVDTVLYLESEKNGMYRLLRSTKNRFGSASEVGVFEMSGHGLIEVSNPSSIFIDNAELDIPGGVISCVMDGNRPFLIEVQSLVSKTVFGYPQRKTAGFDLNRLQILTAVLSKRVKIKLLNQDVIVNIVGGLKSSDTALDSAVCLSIVSSLLNQKIDKKTLVLGEVGLGGEIRNVNQLDKRLDTAKKLGFTRAVIPSARITEKDISLIKYKNIKDLISGFFTI